MRQTCTTVYAGADRDNAGNFIDGGGYSGTDSLIICMHVRYVLDMGVAMKLNYFDYSS